MTYESLSEDHGDWADFEKATCYPHLIGNMRLVQAVSLVANIPAFPFHDTPLVGLQASPVPDFQDHGARYMRIQKPLDDSVAKVNGLPSEILDIYLCWNRKSRGCLG